MQSYVITATALVALFTTSLAQIDPATVPIATRQQWCTSQFTQCPLLCTQIADGSAGTEANTCDATTLDYACVCSNGLSPNSANYSQTIPYFICTETNTQCVKNCGMNNNACAASCTQNNPCGASDPTRVNTTTTATTTTATNTGNIKATASDGGVVYNGFGGSSATPASSSTHGSGAARLLAGGEAYGLSIIAAGIFAGFAMLA